MPKPYYCRAYHEIQRHDIVVRIVEQFLISDLHSSLNHMLSFPTNFFLPKVLWALSKGKKEFHSPYTTTFTNNYVLKKLSTISQLYWRVTHQKKHACYISRDGKGDIFTCRSLHIIAANLMWITWKVMDLYHMHFGDHTRDITKFKCTWRLMSHDISQNHSNQHGTPILTSH